MLAAAHRFQKPTATARISLSGARASYVGPGLDLAPHRNAAATIAIAVTESFSLAFFDNPGAAQSPILQKVALIPPGALHHLQSQGDMAFLYLDALSDDHACIRTMDMAAVAARLTGPASSRVRECGVDALCDILGVAKREPADPRIASVVRALDARPQDFLRVEDAARLAGLSPSRFQALFRQAVGMAFRRYRLWRRMAVVVQAIAAGHSLTDGALDAGFASSSHLSAAFKAMFGLTPSNLADLAIDIVVAA